MTRQSPVNGCHLYVELGPCSNVPVPLISMLRFCLSFLRPCSALESLLTNIEMGVAGVFIETVGSNIPPSVAECVKTTVAAAVEELGSDNAPRGAVQSQPGDSWIIFFVGKWCRFGPAVPPALQLGHSWVTVGSQLGHSWVTVGSYFLRGFCAFAPERRFII